MSNLNGLSGSASDFVSLGTSEWGIKTSFKIEDGKYLIHKEQNLAPVLDNCKAQRNQNDGWNKARDMRRVAHIPQILIDHWKNVEGWDCFAPENMTKLARILNDGDFAHLRTADGVVAVSNGVLR